MLKKKSWEKMDVIWYTNSEESIKETGVQHLNLFNNMVRLFSEPTVFNSTEIIFYLNSCLKDRVRYFLLNSALQKYCIFLVDLTLIWQSISIIIRSEMQWKRTRIKFLITIQ
jgi:hypothetical protein